MRGGTIAIAHISDQLSKSHVGKLCTRRTRENQIAFASLFAHRLQYCQSSIRKRHRMRVAPFHAICWNTPLLFLPGHFAPNSASDFAAASRRQDEKLNPEACGA